MTTTCNTSLDFNDLPGELQMGVGYAEAWQFVSRVWNSGANTSVILRLVTDGYPNGAAWFDDIALVREDQALPNPSFEGAGGSSTDAVGWTEWSGYQRASDRAHSGNRAMKSTTPSGSAAFAGPIPIEPGRMGLGVVPSSLR